MVQVAEVLSSRSIRFGGASPFGKQSHRLLQRQRFCEEVQELVKKKLRGALNSHCLLIQDKTDKVLTKLREEAHTVAMSFPEFIDKFGKADTRPLWSSYT